MADQGLESILQAALAVSGMSCEAVTGDKNAPNSSVVRGAIFLVARAEGYSSRETSIFLHRERVAILVAISRRRAECAFLAERMRAYLDNDLEAATPARKRVALPPHIEKHAKYGGKDECRS